MMTLVWIGIGIVLLTVGIFFVVNGYLSTPNENTVVLFQDLEKVKMELVQTRESEAKLKMQLEQQRIQFETAERNLEAAKAKEESVLRSLQDFQTSVAAQEQIYKSDIAELKREIALIKEKADTQAKEALELVNSLSAEKGVLKNALENVETKLHQLEAERDSAANLSANNELLKSELGVYQTKIQELERELHSIQKENQQYTQESLHELEHLKEEFLTKKNEHEDQSLKTAAAIEVLHQEKQRLLLEKEHQLIQLEALRQQLEAVKTDSSRHWSAAIDHVKSENMALRSQIKEHLERLQPLEAQLLSLQKEKEERTVAYEQTIGDLRGKNQLLQTWLEENLGRLNQLENELSSTRRHGEDSERRAQDTIDSLTQERNMLLKMKGDLESSLQKMKDANTTLSQKEELLQYELTKTRAQSMSFESGCKDLTLDVEARLKEINSVKTENKTIRAQQQMQQEESLLRIRQLESELSSIRKKSESEISEAHSTIENLQTQNEAFLAAKADLEKDSKKIKEFSANLLQKEDMLQYELTKARAQAMGLEKISEDFKVEIETHLKQIGELKEENRSLRQLQQETAQNLHSLKKAQDEYMKREKLYQTELEKSRNQLLGMEQVYSDFRSKFESIEAIKPNRTAKEKAET